MRDTYWILCISIINITVWTQTLLLILKVLLP